MQSDLIPVNICYSKLNFRNLSIGKGDQNNLKYKPILYTEKNESFQLIVSGPKLLLCNLVLHFL